MQVITFSLSCLRYPSLKFIMMLGKFVTIHNFCECSIPVILHTVKRVTLYNFQTFLIQCTFAISELPMLELIFYWFVITSHWAGLSGAVYVYPDAMRSHQININQKYFLNGYSTCRFVVGSMLCQCSFYNIPRPLNLDIDNL